MWCTTAPDGGVIPAENKQSGGVSERKVTLQHHLRDVVACLIETGSNSQQYLHPMTRRALQLRGYLSVSLCCEWITPCFLPVSHLVGGQSWLTGLDFLYLPINISLFSPHHHAQTSIFCRAKTRTDLRCENETFTLTLFKHNGLLA